MRWYIINSDGGYLEREPGGGGVLEKYVYMDREREREREREEWAYITAEKELGPQSTGEFRN